MILNLLKKFKSVIILSIVTTAIFVPVIVTTIQASNYPLLFSVGSSAVKPVLEDFSKIYNNKVNDKFDLIIDAGGSSTGIESIAYGYTQIGNTSRTPKSSEVGIDGRYNNEWEKNKLKTITLGWDAIAVVYKPSPSDKEILDISDKNIDKLYKAMTGVYEGKNYTLNDLDNRLEKTEITAYPRSGGSRKSGTADAFANDSHLKGNWANKEEEENVKTALKDGQYNFKRGNINVTNESNAETWLRVLNDNKVGAITYLSTGFVLNNLKAIEDNGFKIATYNGIKMNFESIANGSNGYNWVRPINTIISLNDKYIDQYIDFLYWLFSSQVYAFELNKVNQKDEFELHKEKFMTKNQFEKIGIKPLTIEQIKSMTNKNNTNTHMKWDFRYSDYDINQDFNKKDLQFGAKL